MQQEYRIGNGLRGFYHFEAENDEVAWLLGCAIFNVHFPSETGRYVYLEKWPPPPPLREGVTQINTTDEQVVQEYVAEHPKFNL
jgi:hypothetical protein